MGVPQSLRNGISSRPHCNQVDVIVHKTVGPNRHVELSGVTTEQFEINVTIFVRSKDDLSMVSTVSDVKRPALEHDPCDSRHLGRLPVEATGFSTTVDDHDRGRAARQLPRCAAAIGANASPKLRDGKRPPKKKERRPGEDDAREGGGGRRLGGQRDAITIGVSLFCGPGGSHSPPAAAKRNL